MIQADINLKLDYTMFCEDVRLEASNQLSLMGVIHQIVVPQFPVALFKFAVVNHWRGDGEYLSEVRILTPDRRRTVAVSQPASFSVNEGGYADNVTVFVNTSFAEPGHYVVQTLINSSLFAEKVLPVIKVDQQQVTESSRIN
ncbi:MAG: hypothetical protein IPM66_23840 [Acidobacteriota bacterium]|nr:MAG: hypothetical protein IPM66_23840 [Acidobacteriota bacterium]